MNFSIQNGRVMAQTVRRRPLTAENWVRSRISQCEICVGQMGSGTGFLFQYLDFPQSVSFPPMLHTDRYLRVALKRRTNGRSLGTFKQKILFKMLGSAGHESIFILIFES
jgi:hypothetical protein